MATKNKAVAEASDRVWNVPNGLTALRFLLAIALVALIPLEQYQTALVLFVVAASTDWIDGHWARRYGQVTKVGRVFDPFVDKIVICGAFICLCAQPGSGIHAAVAVLVVAREMLVTALRGQMESMGIDFSAKFSGKLKMLFQCIAVVCSLYVLMGIKSYRLELAQQELALPAEKFPGYGQVDLQALLPEWLFWALMGSVGIAVVFTLYSGIVYVLAVAQHMRQRS